MTQPSLSAQINQLEAALGFRLFVRSTRSVSLSEEGITFLVEARRLVDESNRLAQTIRAIRRRTNERLRVGAALYTISMPDRQALLEGFAAANPSVSLSIDSCAQKSLVAELDDGSLDISLLIGVSVPREKYKAASAMGMAELLYPDDLSTHTIASSRIALSVDSDDELANQAVIAPGSLRGRRIAMLGPYHGEAVIGPLSAYLRDCGSELVVPPEATAIGIERYGSKMGIPAVSVGWFDHDGGGKRVRRYVEGLTSATQMVLVWPDRHLMPAAASFLQYARDMGA